MSKAVSRVGHPQDGNLPLHLACPDECIGTGTKFLFDAYPEALVTPNAHGEYPNNSFLESQRKYALGAKITSEVATPDGDGQLLLHRALQDEPRIRDSAWHWGASLGAIKLIMKANTAALSVHDNNLLLPVQLACRVSTHDVIKFLIEQDRSAVEIRSASTGDFLLHFACQSGNTAAATYLSKEFPSLVSSGCHVRIAMAFFQFFY